MTHLEDHLDKLPIFLEVVRAGSIRRAARTLGKSQPSVSRAIRLIEEAAGSRLFVRDPHGIKLTLRGQHLFELADKLRTGIAEFRASSSNETKIRQQVSFGAFESIAIYLFPGFLRYASGVQNELEISLVTASSAELMTALRRSRVDIILSVAPHAHRDVVSKGLFDDEFRVYRHPALTVTASTPVLGFLSAADARGKTIEKHLNGSRLARRPRYLCESFELVNALTTAGLGLGILPGRVAQRALRSAELVEEQPMWRFGAHPIAVSFLAHRLGDSGIVWLQRALERYVAQS